MNNTDIKAIMTERRVLQAMAKEARMPKLLVKKIHPDAKLPKRGSKGSAGYDLYSIESAVIEPGDRKLFKLGIQIAIPEGYYGKNSPRSGLALKGGIGVMAGVIDEDYRGELGTILINQGKQPVKIEAGDRICQIIFKKYEVFNIVETDSFDQTERGSGSFGSTGSK